MCCLSLSVPESLTPCLLWDLTNVTLACVWRFMQPLQKSPNLSLPYPLLVLTGMLLMPEQNKSHVIVAISDHFKKKILLINFFWHHLLPYCTWGPGGRGDTRKWSYQFSCNFRQFREDFFCHQNFISLPRLLRPWVTPSMVTLNLFIFDLSKLLHGFLC